MIRHIVIWDLPDKSYAPKIKQELEELANCVPGVVELKVNFNALPSSNKDIILNSLFESEEALKSYQGHPAHVKAGEFIKAVTQNRVCIDYIEET